MTSVSSRWFAFALTVSACNREPCVKLGHPWSPPSELESITADPKPRCAPIDPTCGPEPYDSERACYDPSARRLPIPADGSRNSAKRCAHDGECVLVSSCRVCEHYSVASSVKCEKRHAELAGALCGCLDGACGFFRN